MTTATITPERSRNVRGAELGQLCALVDTLADPATPRVVDVVGEPGMGKTRLLAALTGEAARRGIPVVRSRCTELDGDVATHLLDRVAEHPGGWCAGAPGRQTGRPHALRRALAELAGGTRLVVVVDDVHWADPRSLDAVEQLLRIPLEGPIGLVLARRPRQSRARLRGALAQAAETGTVQRLDLRPLTPAQTAALLGLPPGGTRVRELALRCEGNPLYLRLAAAEDSATAEPDGRDRRYEHTGAAGPVPRDDRPLPEPFGALLATESASLPPEQAGVAAGGAVLGDPFDADAVAAVVRLPRDEVCRATARLVDRDILRTVEGTDTYRFRHPALRRAVYADTDPCWRSGAHRRALGFLAERGTRAAELAVHVQRSPASGVAAADVAILVAAAREAETPHEAASWLCTALRLLPGGTARAAQRAELTREAVELFQAAGDEDAALELLAVQVPLIPVDAASERISAVAFHARTLCLSGDDSSARALLDAELARVRPGPRGAPPGAARLLVQRATLALLHESPPAPSAVRSALRLARVQHDRVAEAGALALRAICGALHRRAGRPVVYGTSALPGGFAGALVPAPRAAGAPPDASPGSAPRTSPLEGLLRSVQAAEAALDGLDDRRLADHPDVPAMVGWAELLLGRHADARLHLRRAADLATPGRPHSAPPPSLATAGLCHLHMLLGRPAEARAAAPGIAHASGAPGDPLHALFLALDAWTLALTPGTAPDDRAEALARAVDAARLLPADSEGLGAVAVAVAGAEAARADRGPGQASATALLARGGGPGALPPVLQASCFEALAEAALRARDTAVRTWAWRATEVSDFLELPASRAYARVARAHAVRNRPALAAQLCRDAARLFGAAGMSWAQAWTLTAATPHLVAAGQASEAETVLRSAGELARRCGFRPLRAREARAVDPGAADDALAPLTAREREVAVLAGRGVRSREIADALGLSPRTVDVHLTRVYRKLGIASRTALAHLMAETRPTG